MDIRILIGYYKKDPIIKSNELLPIHLGKANSNIDLKIIGDDIGDNISLKNKYYCELTAIYWAWKNCTADYKGIMHYRRLLNFKNKNRQFYKINRSFYKKFGLEEDIKNTCSQYDFILPKKDIFYMQKNPSMYNQYKYYHIKSDLERAIEIIREKYPDMYDTSQEVLHKNQKAYFYNIIIAKKECFDEYCKWLFSILFQLEKELLEDIKKRDLYQQRALGFLSERLFNIYIEHLKKNNDIKIKELPVIFFVQNKNGLMDKLRRVVKKYKRKILTSVGLGKEKWKR